MSVLEFTCAVGEDGHLPEARRRQVAAHLRRRAGGEVRVCLSGPRRSTQANAYYWGCIVAPIQRALAEAGHAYPRWAIHEQLKEECLPLVAATVADEVGEPPEYADMARGPNGRVYARLTTTRLDAAAFHYYAEACKTREWVLALGIDFEDAPDGLRSGRVDEPAT